MQIQSVHNLEGILSSYLGEDIVIMGYLNVCLDPELDRLNNTGSNIANPSFRVELNSFMEAFLLIDVWRVQNPGKQGFTWYRSAKASRLNYVLCSDHVLEQVRQYDICDVSHSDHLMVVVNLGPKPQNRGKDFWKLNSFLLNVPEVFESLIELVEENKKTYEQMDHTARWELLKFDLRNFFRKCNSDIIKERNKIIVDLQEQIRELSKITSLGGEEIETLYTCRRKLFSF